jgi:hypothetical protein
MNFATDIFALPSSLYVKTVVRRWLRRYIWIYIIAAAFCILGSCIWSTAWAFVGLMLAFILLPTSLMMVYFNYALKPQALRQTMPHSIILSADTITVKACPNEDYPKTLGDASTPATYITSLKLTKQLLTIVTGSAVDDVILITTDAFGDDPQRADRFIKAIYLTFQQNCVTLHS